MVYDLEHSKQHEPQSSSPTGDMMNGRDTGPRAEPVLYLTASKPALLHKRARSYAEVRLHGPPVSLRKVLGLREKMKLAVWHSHKNTLGPSGPPVGCLF